MMIEKIKILALLRMFVISLSALAGVLDASAFYNPTTGRWLSRDPIEEGGGENLLALANNDPVSSVDLLGGKTLPFAVARDWTLRGPVGGVYDKYVKERNPVMEKGLQEVIDKCTTCTSIKAAVKLVYAPKTILPVPDEVRQKKRSAWDIGIDSDLKLMFENYDKLSKTKASVPMFWTLESILDSRDKDKGTRDAAGVGTHDKGITLTYVSNKRFHYLLAHEFGHYLGLGHCVDTDTDNVMNRLHDGGTPDADYCKKVLEVFK